MERRKIIYIAGFGYSGSTLLERLLAIHPDIVGCGETHHVWEDFREREICSCGRKVDECSFWGEAYRRYQDPTQQKTTTNIFTWLPIDVPFLIDSSKTTRGNMRRPFQLQEHYEVYLIHLSRHGRSCLHSQWKRNPRNRFYQAIKTAIHWKMAHRVALNWKTQYPDAYFHLRYEDLVEQPAEKLNTIFQWLKLDATTVLQHLEEQQAIPTTHQLSGNAIRQTVPLFLKKPTTTLPPPTTFAEKAFTLLAQPMLKQLGY